MIRSYSLFFLACCLALVPGHALAASLDGAIAAPVDEFSPRVTEPFSLAIRNLTWDGDPHAMSYGNAVLAADGQVVWELADVTRAVASADGGTVALLTRDYHVFVSTIPEPPRQIDSHGYLSPRLSNDGTLLVGQRLGEGGGHILDRTRNTQGIALVNLVTGEDRLLVEGNDLYSPSFASEEIVFFGSGGNDQIASLYALDLGAMSVARVTNREKGARQTFPSEAPRLVEGMVVYRADDELFRVPLPAASDFVALHRFDPPKAVVSDSAVQPDTGSVHIRRPTVQVKTPKVLQYYDVDKQNGKIKDWACFQKTYDQHEGTDFNQSYGFDVVAPASGQVTRRYDGCADTNSWGCGSGLGNHADITHTDRTVSVEAHGKKWTVVDYGWYACGDTLMKSASSGNSNVYHVHHEMWTDPEGCCNPTHKFDPFQGSCDPSDPTKWSTQNGYNDLPGTTCTN